jgi:hypothetical protein
MKIRLDGHTFLAAPDLNGVGDREPVMLIARIGDRKEVYRQLK